MKKAFLLFSIILLTLSSCVSDQNRFDYLRSKYPNCDIYTDRRENSYIVSDTTNSKGAIYRISFYGGSEKKILNIDRIR